MMVLNVTKGTNIFVKLHKVYNRLDNGNIFVDFLNEYDKFNRLLESRCDNLKKILDEKNKVTQETCNELKENKEELSELKIKHQNLEKEWYRVLEENRRLKEGKVIINIPVVDEKKTESDTEKVIEGDTEKVIEGDTEKVIEGDTKYFECNSDNECDNEKITHCDIVNENESDAVSESNSDDGVLV
jgi:hypothetical protein